MTATRPDYVIGVDPGPRHTGIIVRKGHDGTIPTSTAYRPAILLDRPTIGLLLVTLDGIVDALHPTTNRITIAVEDVNPPNPHMGTIAVAGLIGTAKLIGALLAAYPQTVLVPPGRHGGKPGYAYPAQLRDPRGDPRAVGQGKLRHIRSAYDIAATAGLHAPRPWGTLPTPTAPNPLTSNPERTAHLA